MHTQIKISKSLSSAAARGVGDFSETFFFPHCKKADLDDDRGSPQELLSCGRGPTSSTAILNRSDKSLKRVEEERSVA